MKETKPSNAALALRVSEIRNEVFGEGPSGLDCLAAKLSLPPRTWSNYESGATIPGTVLLHFIDVTGVDPHWLMTGFGEHYSSRPGRLPGRISRAGLSDRPPA